MPKTLLDQVFLGLCLWTGFTKAMGATVWNESTQGDLSNDPSSPTSLSVSAGSNLLNATSGGAGPDRDFFRFIVPVGHQLTGIILNQFTTAFDGKAFIGVQLGNAITVDPNNPTATPLLGYAHFGPDVEPLAPPFNYLPTVATGVGSIQFNGALGPGQYSFWTQQTSSGSPSSYQLDFVITPIPVDVPIPAWGWMLQATLMMAIGGWMLASRREIVIVQSHG